MAGDVTVDWDGYLLALETATETASLALLDDQGGLVAETTFRARRTMAERLTAVLDRLLRDVDVTPNEVGALAVGLGPGSFTSLRVGLATAQGLLLARPRPVVGIGTLEILAAAAPLNERAPICAVIAAPKRHLYAALYARRTPDEFNCLFGPELLPTEALAERLGATGLEVVVVGRIPPADAAVLAGAGATLLPPVHGTPRAAVAGWLGWQRLRRGQRHDPAQLTPLYVLPSEAEVRFGRVYARPNGPVSADD